MYQSKATLYCHYYVCQSWSVRNFIDFNAHVHGIPSLILTKCMMYNVQYIESIPFLLIKIMNTLQWLIYIHVHVCMYIITVNVNFLNENVTPILYMCMQHVGTCTCLF